MKMEPKTKKEKGQYQIPTCDEDDNPVSQIRIPITKKNKGTPDSRCSSWIGIASHQSNRVRDGSHDMGSTISSMSRNSENFLEIR
jgi:hypothetical protein